MKRHTQPLVQAPTDGEIDGIVESLARRFPESPRRIIEDLVTQRHLEFSGARLRTNIPNMVEHEARVDLRAQLDSTATHANLPVAA